VADFVDGAAENEVADKPMAVRRHRNQVAMFAFRGFDDFARRISEGEVGRDFESALAQM